MDPDFSAWKSIFEFFCIFDVLFLFLPLISVLLSFIPNIFVADTLLSTTVSITVLFLLISPWLSFLSSSKLFFSILILFLLIPNISIFLLFLLFPSTLNASFLLISIILLLLLLSLLSIFIVLLLISNLFSLILLLLSFLFSILILLLLISNLFSFILLLSSFLASLFPSKLISFSLPNSNWFNLSFEFITKFSELLILSLWLEIFFLSEIFIPYLEICNLFFSSGLFSLSLPVFISTEPNMKSSSWPDKFGFWFISIVSLCNSSSILLSFVYISVLVIFVE